MFQSNTPPEQQVFTAQQRRNGSRLGTEAGEDSFFSQAAESAGGAN